MAMMLTDDQIEHYRTHGWVAPITVMSEEEATDLADQLARAEANYPELLHAENRNNAHLMLPFLAELAKHPAIIATASSLVGADMTLSSSVLFIKEPKTGSFVSWHQDARYMGLEPDEFATAWVALSPSTPESGCVAVIPGTHKQGIVEHEDLYGEDNILTRGQQVPGVDESTAVDLVLRPGQMSLHHPWLVHGSRPNTSDYRRIGIAYQSYLSPNVRPTRGDQHVMHISGAPVGDAFVEAQAPTGECTPESLLVRAAANEALSDVLYKGAQIKRAL